MSVYIPPWGKPVARWRVGSGWGPRVHPITGKRGFHNGIDVGMRTGTRLFASSHGKVRRSWYDSRGGHQVVVDYPPIGTTIGMAHLSRRRVKTGQTVSPGELLGLSGNTGLSTSPHVHLTARPLGSSSTVEPVGWFKAIERRHGVTGTGAHLGRWLGVGAAAALVVGLLLRWRG